MTRVDDGRTLVHERTYPVEPADLFLFFSDPARLAAWWGPRGWANEFQHFDLRSGGEWRFTMVGPDGTRIPMRKTFAQVRAPTPGSASEGSHASHDGLVVIDHEQKGHSFWLEMRFAPVPAGTRLVWTTTFATKAQLDAVRDAFDQGNRDNLERLAAQVNGQVDGTAPGSRFLHSSPNG